MAVYKSKFTGQEVDDILTKAKNTTVIANPAGEATDVLNKLQIGAIIYSGLRGEPGIQGPQGEPGIQGPQGEQGPAGPAGTAETLTPEEVKELANAIFNGGGGAEPAEITFIINGVTCTAQKGETFGDWIVNNQYPSELTVEVSGDNVVVNGQYLYYTDDTGNAIYVTVHDIIDSGVSYTHDDTHFPGAINFTIDDIECASKENTSFEEWVTTDTVPDKLAGNIDVGQTYVQVNGADLYYINTEGGQVFVRPTDVIINGTSYTSNLK